MVKQRTEDILTDSTISMLSLDSLIQGYILKCTIEGKSDKTIDGYQMILNNFKWYCDKYQYPNVVNLSPTHIGKFFLYLKNEPHRWDSNSPTAKRSVSQTTVNTYYRALRTFFNWLVNEEIARESPFNHLTAPKIPRKVVQALTYNDIAALLKACSGKSLKDVRNKAIISIFLDSGLRISELTNLTLDDIDFDNGSILVRNGKGNKQRIVRIGTKAQKSLWKYITLYRRSQSNRLFINSSGKPLENTGIKTLIVRLGEKTGIKIHAHKFRHTFAISYLRAGGDVFSLQYLLGHSTLQMTQRYLQSLNSEDAIKAHIKYSPLDNTSL